MKSPVSEIGSVLAGLDRIEQKLNELLALAKNGNDSEQTALLKDVSIRGFEAVRDHNRRVVTQRTKRK